MAQSEAVMESDAASGISQRQLVQFLLVVILLMLPVVMAIPFRNGENLDVRLAHGFLDGHLYADFIEPDFADIIPYKGHYYLPFGILPSVLEMPFVIIFGMDFNTQSLLFVVTLLNGWLVWRLLSKLNVEGSARRWLAYLFIFGALYYAVATHSGSWEVAKVLVVCFMLTALLCAEWDGWLLAGLLVGCATATRFSALVNALYFVLLIVFANANPVRWRKLALFALGLMGPGLLILWYNYARFGNPLETGYALSLPAFTYQYAARAQGLFSVVHIPTNFYYMFLSGFDSYPSGQAPQLQFPWVQPSLRGMGIFVTTPALIYLFRVPLQDRRVRAALPTVALGVLTLLMYYYTGEYQYGYSYLLDFMPLIFVLLIAALRPVQGCTVDEAVVTLPPLFKRLALASILLGVWGALWAADIFQYWGEQISHRLAGG